MCRDRFWNASLVFGLAALLCTRAALADGWHRPGDPAPTKPLPSSDGPALMPPVVTPRPTAAKAAPKKVITSDPAPVMPDLAESDDDQWAERALATRTEAKRQRRSDVVRAEHQAKPQAVRQVPPSAFAKTAYFQPGPVITNELLGAPDSEPSTEELPSPNREFLPPINTDQLLSGYHYGGDPYASGRMMDHDGMHGGCDSCSSCGDGGSCSSCGPCGGWSWHRDAFRDLSIFGGTHGFKGPVDLGRNGNFGFHYGLNYGAPIWLAERIGYQVGGQIVHSNLSGSDVLEPTDSSRTQYFITAGLFRRAFESSPFQWGIAYDWLSDNYYVNMQFAKLRGEVSFVGSSGDEIGAWMSVDVMDDTKYIANGNNVTEFSWQSADLFAFFWRRHYCEGGALRLWGGFTDKGDGLLGGDFRAPMSDYFAIEGNSNYLAPTNGGFHNGALRESWALSLNLVLYVGGGARLSSCTPWMPLFNVADNSIFMFNAAK